MGSSSSDLTQNLKAQACEQYTSSIDYSTDDSIYKYVGIHGDGELLDLMKVSVISKDFKQVDNVITTKIFKYLLNNGKGDYVPIKDLTQVNVNQNSPESNLFVVAKKFSVFLNITKVCFDTNKRGAVGETLLHLCLLNNTYLHNELAKRLLLHFPAMVNDCYMSEEFFGQSALHIAIVNQDTQMTRLLIQYGANLHQRCLGKFFFPNDLKKSRSSSGLFSFITRTETNYFGDFYFGEYPLSFAACLNLQYHVRILLANGADPNKQDTHGNTVLHMLVIYNNLSMLKYLIQSKADYSIRNKEALTPFTLSAKLARKDIFQYLLKIKRSKLLVYADIACGSYALRDFDSLGIDGTINEKSALHLIVNGKTNDHLEMISLYFSDLLYKKWNNYARKRFYSELFFFMVYFSLYLACILMKTDYYSYIRQLMDEQSINVSNCTLNNSKAIHETCVCFFSNSADPNKTKRVVVEIIILVYTVGFFLFKINELRLQRLSQYINNLLQDLAKLLFVLSLLSTLFILPARLACWTEVEEYLTVISVLLMSTNFFYFCGGFKRLGNFVAIFQKILHRDLSKFFVIYSIFLIGFSQAFYIAMIPQKNTSSNRTHIHSFSTPLHSIYTVMIMSLGESHIVYDEFEKMQTNRFVTTILYIVYQIIVSILLVNMLIAMMANTYISATEKRLEWVRQWAKMILTIEQNINVKTRLREQKKYTNLMISGERDLVVKWKMKDKEINELRKSNLKRN